ncbi:MAG TPA: PBSX family phage terminase large subunit [Candidatus Levilactobacillus faecigallinarum]|uniref:PBSX family phage terminase large subunit n=1 Tax=Candidatus Levilactobacillus faecigallinarum TaxID=2838638 RepID=A0A9D1U5D3_9LACO|nr:PBSX family phage terminase large subunit [Candidatus Levilactobacillus faecigallinarum]
MEINVNLDNLINPHFDNVLFSDALNKVLEGGRGSTKSSVISIQLVTDFLMDPHGNALVMRKVGKNIGLSVYEQIKWAIYELHVESQFRFTTSPYRIMHKKTGTAFYFSGVDDPQKLKSIIIANGYVRWLWFEELAEFGSWEEIDTVRLSFTRKNLPPGMHVITYCSYNPPRNPYEWINQWADSRRGMANWYVDHSTYKDDVLGFLSQDYLDEIKVVKQNDYDYYRWMYLGEEVGLGTNVYNMDLFHPIKELFPDDPLTDIAYTTDAGHINSATTCLAIGLTARGKVILLNTYYYSPAKQVRKKAPSDLVPEIHTFEENMNGEYRVHLLKRTIDSAEGALRNEFVKEYNEQWHGVAKKDEADMIDYVSSLLAQGRVYYMDIPANQIFIEQHRQYQWDQKTIQSDYPKVVKVNDHTPDAFKYFAIDNARKLGLKQGKAIAKAKPKVFG